jgi:putative transposase
MLEAVGEVFPETKYQRCTIHFYRNVFSVVLRSKVKQAARRSRQSTLRKARRLREKSQSCCRRILENEAERDGEESGGRH